MIHLELHRLFYWAKKELIKDLAMEDKNANPAHIKL